MVNQFSSLLHGLQCCFNSLSGSWVMCCGCSGSLCTSSTSRRKRPYNSISSLPSFVGPSQPCFHLFHLDFLYLCLQLSANLISVIIAIQNQVTCQSRIPSLFILLILLSYLMSGSPVSLCQFCNLTLKHTWLIVKLRLSIFSLVWSNFSRQGKKNIGKLPGGGVLAMLDSAEKITPLKCLEKSPYQ